MGKIEDIILRHSGRGMNLLRPYMSENYCTEAASEILNWNHGCVLLTTGFYVAGHAETDGPAGTYALAKALKTLGYQPVIVTDSLCYDLMKETDIETYCVNLNAGLNDYEKLLEEYAPVGIISIERCGRNAQNDYCNMRGISIKEHTASIDDLFYLAKGRIPTIGIGDGGNEIGMGNLLSAIHANLEIDPCVVGADKLVIASVSNWGAYGIAAALESLSGKKVLLSANEILGFLKDTIALGSIDGVTKAPTVSVDGFDAVIGMEIINSLHQYCANYSCAQSA